MKSRKHLKINKKSRKSRKIRKGRKTRKGGALPYECNPSNLSMITGPDALHANYQKCCPKDYLGNKNSSSYCRELETKFKSALVEENKSYGDEDNEVPVAQLPQREFETNVAQTKPWYKFWGGKKTKKHRK